MMTIPVNAEVRSGSIACGERWGIQVGYSFLEDHPYLDVNTTSLRLTARQENFGVKVSLPKGEWLSWDFEAGQAAYQVWIPSAATTNQLARSEGYSAGVGVSFDLVRKTVVTPRVYSRLSWRIAETKPRRIYLEGDRRWEAVEEVWQTRTTALAVGAQNFWKEGALLAGGGFEIFSKTAELADQKTGQEFKGTRMDYRFYGEGAWRFSSTEALRAEVSLGSELGYRVALEQRF